MTNETVETKKSVAPTVTAKASIFRPGPDIPEKPPELLVSILRTKRCHGSIGDTNFRLWLNKELSSYGYKPQILSEGSLLVRTNPKSDTLFSCHIDTCHGQAESDGTSQDLAYDSMFGHIVLAAGSKSACLGADDGAGIYIMLRMIQKKVPGSYLFHVGEERGGIGSRAVLTKHKPFLEEFSRAIAFDRGVHQGDAPEVIYTQGGYQCASTDFATRLAAEYNKHSELFADDWVISPRGSFTDTKIYAGVIPECINLGVFYAKQHGPNEYLDAAHLESMVTASCAIKWDDLKVAREPKAEFVPPPSRGMGAYDHDFGMGFGYDSRDFKGATPAKSGTTKSKKSVPPTNLSRRPESVGPTTPELVEELASFSRQDYIEFCEDDPEMVANVLVYLVAKLKAAEVQAEVLHNFIGMT